MALIVTPALEGKTVRAYHGLVTDEAIVGAHILKDCFAGIRDTVGGRSAAYEHELHRVRAVALQEMEEAAQQKGGNCVAGSTSIPRSSGGVAACSW